MLNIPYSQRPEFIPRPPHGECTTFARAAALFAHGDVDAVLVSFFATQASISPTTNNSRNGAHAVAEQAVSHA